MGADVIKIEKPGGDPARNIGPFIHDTADPLGSLFWSFGCMNKRSVTLDIETPEGKNIFEQMVKTADFVVESFPPGHMSSLGLGYEDLEKVNPRIIMVSITPFGQEGPCRDYSATDLTVWAMAGPLYLTGDPDRAPVQLSYPQAFAHAGASAAVGALVAHSHREATGEGQHVDVSAQHVCGFVAMDAPAYWEILNVEMKRAGPGRDVPLPKGTARVRFVYPCKDGHVFYLAPGANVMLSAAKAWTEWLLSEGVTTDHMKHFGWPEIDFMEMTPEDFEMMQDTLGRFMMKHTKVELYEGALQREIPLVPLSSPKDVLDNSQLKERGFWMEMQHDQEQRQTTFAKTKTQ
ncbi:CaiB/BaiF CoA transferase family protein, partial [Thermodesulfobacteriota bacterium]